MAINLTQRIGLDDIDAAGVAFGPTIVAIAHRAYEAALFAAGIDLAALIRNGEYGLPLVHLSCDFFAPLRHGDQLTVTIHCSAIGSTSYTMTITIRGSGDDPAAAPRCCVQQVHACIDRTHGRPIPVPPELRAALENQLADS